MIVAFSWAFLVNDDLVLGTLVLKQHAVPVYVFFLNVYQLWLEHGHLRSLTRNDVYKTLCPQQMLVHKGGQINNVQLITGLRIAENGSYCENVKKERKSQGGGGDVYKEWKLL